MEWWSREGTLPEQYLGEVQQVMQDILSKNTKYSLRQKLLELKQIYSIHVYVKAYQAKMLEIPNISEDNKLDHFMVNL